MDRSQTRDRVASFNYLVSTKQSSLYRNGQISLHRNPDGSDSGIQGLDLEAVKKTVHDGRALATPPRLSVQGFELLDAPLSDPSFDFFDAERLVRLYYREVEEVVASAVGASYAVAFDHNLRWAQGKKEERRLEKGQQVQAPIQLVHGDYTLTSGPERLRQLSRPPRTNDTLRGFLPEGKTALHPSDAEEAIAGNRRYAIINLWRSIAPEPVLSHPLAACDARTVDPSELVVFEIHYTDRVGENYFIKAADAHGWHYFPEMTPGEPLLIKQWDSAGAIAQSEGREADGQREGSISTFSVHSAFEDPETPEGAPDRQSLEVRCVVIW